jgi:hypothetical protein
MILAAVDDERQQVDDRKCEPKKKVVCWVLNHQNFQPKQIWDKYVFSVSIGTQRYIYLQQKAA